MELCPKHSNTTNDGAIRGDYSRGFLLHLECGIKATLRMVLVRQRRAPNRAKIPSPVD
jgi:hypothetical protein